MLTETHTHLSLDQLLTLVHGLTLPSRDNQQEFTETQRLETLQRLLATTPYQLRFEAPLAKVYALPTFEADKPFVLVSAHIDSVYESYHSHEQDGLLTGTYDNSLCNAIITTLMSEGVLPSQVLVAFTGDEETREGTGVHQTIKALYEQDAFQHLNFVLVLDLTEEQYGQSPYNLENLFVEQETYPPRTLQFRNTDSLADFLRSAVPEPFCCTVEGEPDESWDYDEYDLNCASLCLPCRPIGNDMHDDAGVAVPTASVLAYANALRSLLDHCANALPQSAS